MLNLWKDIIGYEGLYQINQIGEIISTRRSGSKGTILKFGRTNRGHKQVTLSKNNIKKTFSIHKLIYINFIGEIPDGFQIDHADGIKDHNYPENLRLVTASQNVQYAYELGINKSKLNINEVKQIKRLLNEGNSIRKIGKLFKVSGSVIFSIKHNKTWKHVEEELS